MLRDTANRHSTGLSKESAGSSGTQGCQVPPGSGRTIVCRAETLAREGWTDDVWV